NDLWRRHQFGEQRAIPSGKLAGTDFLRLSVRCALPNSSKTEVADGGNMKHGPYIRSAQSGQAFAEIVGGTERLGFLGAPLARPTRLFTHQKLDLVPSTDKEIGQLGPELPRRDIRQATNFVQRFVSRAGGHHALHAEIIPDSIVSAKARKTI